MKRAVTLTTTAVVMAALLMCCSGSGQSSGSNNAGQPSGTSSASQPSASDSSGGQANTSQPVKLTIYFLGDGTKDDDAVFEKLNERTSQLINTTFDRKLLTWADYNTKYPLVFASGEDFDLIFTANWSFYAQQSVKDGFLELTDNLLSTYAPNIWKNVPEDAWKQARINGKVYMIPNTQKEYNNLGILIRGDLRKKYNIPEITSLDILEQYMDAIAKNETGILPLNGGAEFDKWTNNALWFTQPNGMVNSSIPGYAYYLNDPSGKLVKLADLPEYQAYLAKMVDYNNRGFWGKDALNQQNRLDDNFKNGMSAIALHNVGTMISAWQDTNKNHPEWDAEIYDSMFGTYPTVRTSYLGNGMAVHATSKNPERSLMWLDTIRFDRDCYDLMMYGIEGSNWINAGDGVFTPGPNSADYGGFSNWGFTTEQMIRTSTDQWPGYKPLMDSYDAHAVNNPAFYFLFDDSDVKNETAAMTNITQKYGEMFDFGFDKNWQQTIQDVEKQYDNAGRQKAKDLYDQQLSAFLDEYNK